MPAISHRMIMVELITALSIPTARSAVVDGLVILSLVLMTVAAIGLVSSRSPVTRLHFLAPASTLALPCFGIAAMISEGLSLGTATIALTVAAGALSAPVLTTSIARLISAQETDHPEPERP